MNTCPPTTADALQLARQLAWVRPLTPYPGWRWDVEWDSSDVGVQIRRRIWSQFHEQQQQVPYLAPWYHGTQLQLYLSNDVSRCVFLTGCIEPNEFYCLHRLLQPGQVFIDAGANDGLFSIFAAAQLGPTGRVWSFEPSQREFARLARNVQLNRLTNVTQFNVALGATDGYSHLTVADDEHAGQNTFGQFAYDAIRAIGGQRVPVRRLDGLVEHAGLECVDVIKIDVEGAEEQVLVGGQATIQRHKPILLMEVNEGALRHQHTSGPQLVERLTDWGYQIYVFDAATGQPRVAAPGEFSDNILAAHSEQPLTAKI
jgi:FkbM family methyltransferase